MLSLIGLLGALALLIVLTVRGMNLFVATPLCALVIALTSDMALLKPLAEPEQADLVSAYMSGFTGFVTSWFFMFLLGAIFGKLMEDSGAAESVARWITSHLGIKRAALAVILACAVLTYGGVSLFVVAFSVYPMALSLFREADLPRRFIPAVLTFGSISITMTAAGSPEIQNWIPIPYLGTTPYAAWKASLIAAIVMAGFGYWWIVWMLNRAKKRGERFESRDDDPVSTRTSLPHPAVATVPLIVVLAASYYLHEDLGTDALIVALLLGSLSTWLVNIRHMVDTGRALAEGSTGALLAIGNTAAVVGFGAVAKAAPAFGVAVHWVTHLPGDPLISASLAVTLIAGMTGSASGGQGIALPILAPHFLGLGVNPDQLHRAVVLSSGVLDALPHNGYLVTTIRAICKETHAAAYPACFAVAVVVTGVGLVLCLVLFKLGIT